MPELPEVETVCRGLALHMEGRRVAGLALNRPDLRVPMPKGLRRRVEGRRIERVARRAKYILVHLEGGGVLVVHLGMSGRMVVTAAGSVAAPPDKHDHVVFTLEDGAVIRFNDARRFGLIDLTTEPPPPPPNLFAAPRPHPPPNHFSAP